MLSLRVLFYCPLFLLVCVNFAELEEYEETQTFYIGCLVGGCAIFYGGYTCIIVDFRNMCIFLFSAVYQTSHLPCKSMQNTNSDCKKVLFCVNKRLCKNSLLLKVKIGMVKRRLRKYMFLPKILLTEWLNHNRCLPRNLFPDTVRM